VTRRRWPAPVRWLLWLLGSVAVTAIAGYLLAALVLFPSPLLPSERAVANVQGLALDDAIRALQRRDLVASVATREPHTSVPAGSVIWQDPPGGVAVPRGDTVRLIVSLGASRVGVPDVRGFDIELAQRLIAAAGLRIDLVDTIAMKSAMAPSGTVGGTTPAAGDSVASGRGLTLHVVQ